MLAFPARKGRRAMTGQLARKVFKARRGTMASPAPKVPRDHPEPMARLDQPDPKARKACREIQVARRALKARRETMARPVLRVRRAR